MTIVIEGAAAISKLGHALLARGAKRICLLGGSAGVYPPYLDADVRAALGAAPGRCHGWRDHDGAARLRLAGALDVTALNRVFTSRRFSAVPSLPLYLRVKKLVNDAISAEELRGGDAIPSERDAAELLGVSRVTVRKAFTELVHDGVLVQRRGSGTFVQGRRAGSNSRCRASPVSAKTCSCAALIQMRRGSTGRSASPRPGRR